MGTTGDGVAYLAGVRKRRSVFGLHAVIIGWSLANRIGAIKQQVCGNSTECFVWIGYLKILENWHFIRRNLLLQSPILLHQRLHLVEQSRIRRCPLIGFHPLTLWFEVS